MQKSSKILPLLLAIILIIIVIVLYSSQKNVIENKTSIFAPVESTIVDPDLELDHTIGEGFNIMKTSSRSKMGTFHSGGVSVDILSIVEDSRCPEGSNCIWAGTVIIKAIVSVDGKESPVLTMALGVPQTFEGKTIEMIQVGEIGNYDFKFSIK